MIGYGLMVWYGWFALINSVCFVSFYFGMVWFGIVWYGIIYWILKSRFELPMISPIIVRKQVVLISCYFTTILVGWVGGLGYVENKANSV